MRILADTHVLLWWLADDPALGPSLRQALTDGGNQVFASSLSVAEIAVKASLGKLEAPEEVAATLAAEGFDHLAFTATHAEALRHLPWHHRDPFDRMLVAQASIEGAALVSHDAALRPYGVTLVW